ncbi:helix-turn-helix domain-containing protein [Acidovorax sp.]|uniref:helix-turn-helix domain-containing protein n=1 Tax=Acidovorax sp. TaxID=1872122 RepID=UPI003D07EFC0
MEFDWKAAAVARAAIVVTSMHDDEVRSALAVVLHTTGALKASRIAELLGRSPSWVYSQQLRFAAEKEVSAMSWHRHGGRRRELMPHREERAFMQHACEKYAMVLRKQLGRDPASSMFNSAPRPTRAMAAGFVPFVMELLEKHVGKPVARGSAYNLMRRAGHSWFDDYKPSSWFAHAYKLV